MGQVTVTLNGRNFQIGCEDGQEAHVQKLARMVEIRVKRLTGSVGQVGEHRLLVMTSLMLADELIETQNTREQALAEAEEDMRAEISFLANALDKLAERLEAIAERLEHA